MPQDVPSDPRAEGGDERAIRALLERWMSASRAGDLGTLLGLVDDDALFLVAGQEPFGKAEFAARFQGFAGTHVEGRSELQEVVVNGDWAWCRARLHVTMTPPQGAPSRRTGQTLTVLRRGPDGRWRLLRDANLLA